MGNSYSGHISRFRFNDTDYAVKDSQIHDDINRSIQSIADFASHVASEFSSFSSFITTTSNFMSNSYIKAVVEDSIKQEYAINIYIDN